MHVDYEIPEELRHALHPVHKRRIGLITDLPQVEKHIRDDTGKSSNDAHAAFGDGGYSLLVADISRAWEAAQILVKKDQTAQSDLRST
jgi:hypothetical protein